MAAAGIILDHFTHSLVVVKYSCKKSDSLFSFRAIGVCQVMKTPSDTVTQFGVKRTDERLAWVCAEEMLAHAVVQIAEQLSYFCNSVLAEEGVLDLSGKLGFALFSA